MVCVTSQLWISANMIHLGLLRTQGVPYAGLSADELFLASVGCGRQSWSTRCSVCHVFTRGIHVLRLLLSDLGLLD